jgi:hypothetical protein
MVQIFTGRNFFCILFLSKSFIRITLKCLSGRTISEEYSYSPRREKAKRRSSAQKLAQPKI